MAAKKMFYKMGEVCEMADLEPHVIRFWETEFPQLSPKKSRAGHRMFTQADIDLVLKIKRLMHEEKMTLKGARKRIAGEPDADPEPEILKHKLLGEVKEVRAVLENVINMLDQE